MDREYKERNKEREKIIAADTLFSLSLTKSGSVAEQITDSLCILIDLYSSLYYYHQHNGKHSPNCISQITLQLYVVYAWLCVGIFVYLSIIVYMCGGNV